MAFWQYTGTAAKYYPTLGFTAQPGGIYDLDSAAPPDDPFDAPDGDDRPSSSKWQSSAGPATYVRASSVDSLPVASVTGDYVAGHVVDADGEPIPTKRVKVVLDANGEIDDLVIEEVA